MTDKIIYIKWKDHVFYVNGWVDPDNVDGDSIVCESVGFLLIEDKDTITITQAKNTLGDVAGVCTILKSDIVRKKYLKI
jgi:hypothetical protein